MEKRSGIFNPAEIDSPVLTLPPHAQIKVERGIIQFTPDGQGEQVALQREPYELRGSRPVLRGRGGEIPPRYSPWS